MLERRGYQGFSEVEAHTIFEQVLAAIDYSHRQGVINFDIKLDNIMLDPQTLQATLIDFGLCDFVTSENKGSFTKRVGSDEYAAPEVMQKSVESFEGSKIDIWCLGAVLYCVLSATFPFEVKQRKQAIKEGLPHPELTFDFPISDEAKDLISKMLELNPEKRITVQEIYEHPWVALM
jgi:serine/threonine protein kinase